MKCRRYIVVLLILLSSSTLAKGQQVLWAAKVLGYSSEYRPGAYGQQYRAVQILGEPDKLPDTGDSPCAWTPSIPDGISEEWIKVGYEKAIDLRQVVIAENHNPGAVVRVYAYDERGEEYLLSEGPELKRGEEPGRLLRLYTKQAAPVRVNAVKIVMKPSLVGGYNQIDAIGISDSEIPVVVAVETAEGLPADLRKHNLGKGVNSTAKEVAPVISPDGTTLYLTRSEHPANTGPLRKQDVWVSSLQPDGSWGTAVNIGAPINNDGDNAVIGISPNGKTLYLLNAYKPDGTMVQGFSKSHLTATGWSFPVPFVIEDHYNDQRTNNTELAISPTEKVLVLSVQRRDSHGDKDLYVCFLQSSGKWSVPLNMGPVVNTPDYEGAPFLAADNKSLYFTSLGHRGYGNGDIFVSRRLDDTWLNWSRPVNLGPLINSRGWDGYFSIPASGEFAYFSSSINPGQSDDIFRVPLYPAIQPQVMVTLSGRLLNAESGQAIEGEVSVASGESGEFIEKVRCDPGTGEFKVLLPLAGTWILTGEKEGFFSIAEDVDLSALKGAPVVSKSLSLVPIRKGQRIHLKQLYFAQSSARLDSASFPELERVRDIMKKYPGMEILLEGHTDNQGDFQKNMKLSEERVKAVQNYLSLSGIDRKRIRLKAWGPSRPVGNNLTEESRKRNRRVELTILEI